MDKLIIDLTDGAEARIIEFSSNVPLLGGVITYALKGRVPQLSFETQVKIVEVRGEERAEAAAWLKGVRIKDQDDPFDYELTVVTTELFVPVKA